MNRNWLISLFLALLFGMGLPFAFAPFNWSFLSILSPALLLCLWFHSGYTPKQNFWQGFCYGLGMFGVGVSWVFVSIHRFGGTDIPLAAIITFLFISILSLWIATLGYVLKRFFQGSLIQFCLLGFPSAWVLFEWSRSVLFTGFPWLFLGYSSIDSPLVHYAPLGSVYLASYAIALSSGCIALIILGTWRDRIIAGAVLLTIFTLGVFLERQWTMPLGSQKSVRLVQGNISPLQKFNREDPLRSTEETYGALTAPHWGADLILWPESAIPLPLPYANQYIQTLDARAKQKGSTLITGIQVSQGRYTHYNALVALGEGQGIYYKHHLVPFGDYLPFDQWLRGFTNFFDLPMSSFSAGNALQDLVTAGDLKLCPEICYEIAFPELIRQSMKDAAAIITLSEDGWFGDSYGPHQHLQIARMRAIETGRPVLRATTSGITAIIDSNGFISASAPQFQALVLEGTFQGMQGTTPWLQWGLIPWQLLWVVIFFLPRILRSWKHIGELQGWKKRMEI